MKTGRKTTGRRIRRAFTLLEIMVAVAAFAIVLWAISAVFTTAIRLRNRTSALIEESLPLEHTLGILKRDLANITASSSTNTMTAMFEANFGGTAIGGMALQTQLCPPFYSTTAILSDDTPFGEVQRVTYYLASSTNGSRGKDLVRATTRNLMPVSQAEETYQYLMTGLQDVHFTFFDGYVWRDVFDQSADVTNATQAIRVDLTMQSDEKSSSMLKIAPISLIVPIMVQAHTNAVDDGTQ